MFIMLYKNWLFVSIEGKMGSTKIWLPTQQGHSNTATLTVHATLHWRVKLPNCMQELDNLWIDAQFVHPYIAYEWQSAIRGIIKMFFGYKRMDSVTGMFAELRLPTFSTLLHKVKLLHACQHHPNKLFRMVHVLCV